MVKGHRSYRQAAKLGVFAMSLMLALAVPCIAFAANTASFSSATPGSGSTISVNTPSISVVVSDRYGISGPTNNSMTVDGVKKQASVTSISGLTKRRFTYPNPGTLSTGLHTVSVWVKDRAGRVSTYSWKFTVAGDRTPPVTTSNALPGYTAAGFITLSAADLDGGHTYYRLDGGLATLYSTPISVGWPGTHLNETHFLEFWSVDGANNTEAHKTVSWTLGTSFTLVHGLPVTVPGGTDFYCTDIAGCHATLGTTPTLPSLTASAGAPVADLAKIHNGECFVCHGAGVVTTNNCITCHGAQGPHGTHASITSTSTPACTSAGCHTGSVTTVVHASCSTCHDPSTTGFIPRATVLAAIANHDDHCEACHGAFTQPGHAAASTASHDATSFAGLGCFGNGCHQTDALVIHTTRITGFTGAIPGCTACHAAGKPPVVTSVNCAQAAPCHGDGTHVDINAIHTVLPAAHISADSCTGLGNTATPCHVTNVATIHTTTLPSGPAAPGCVACHAPAKTASTVCANCHAANPHTGMTGGLPAVAAHNAATNAYWSGCSSSSDCHSASNDASVIHSIWAGAPGCKACHAPTRTPSVDCFTAGCHPANFHGTGPGDNQTVKHTFTALPTACAACHSSNIGDEHVGNYGGLSCATCHQSTDARVIAAIVDGKNNCDACHSGTGSNANLNSIYHGAEFTAATNASGHNVAGNLVNGFAIGAKTRFDGSQGVTLTWEAEETVTRTGFGDGSNGTFTAGQVAPVTTQWDFPTINVFWASDDANAPASATKGLTATSTVTCSGTNGCHDAVAGIQASGPHGATQTWALDANYPGDYSYAELTKYVTANLAYSSANALQTVTTVLDADRYAVPLSASGIAMFPGAAAHANITSASVASTATVPGWVANVSALGNRTDGTTGATAVICAKCHDLENLNALSGQVEGSNTAHDSHHQDQLDGSAQCVNCHIAIPHGWKMPRLLVDTDVDTAPYKDAQLVGTTRTTSSGSAASVAGTTAVNTIKLTAGNGQGFNGQGMQALSGINNHTLGTSGGVQPYNTGDGLPTATLNIGHVGMAYWAEPQCEACGDHTGETPAKIVNGN